MAIFISYSHQDRVFVDQLAANLVKRGRARVWVDRWELRVGDSLIQRIQARTSRSTGSFRFDAVSSS